MNTKLNDFLTKYLLNTDLDSFKTECDKFVTEMTVGLAESGRMLPMIHTYISDEGVIPIDEKIVVVDAGGTNLRVAVVSFDETLTPNISDFSRHDMPGVASEISAEQLFITFAEYIEPYLDECDRVGICFSYPSVSTPDRDAKVMELAKEVKVRGINGRMLCREIQQILEAKGITGKNFTLVNDSVATQLAGKLNADSNEYIGYILGTGQNICYSEKIQNISRLPVVPIGSADKTMIVNVESAYYSRYQRGALDDILDAESGSPGSHPLEKMTSGAYLGNITLRVLKAAAAEELFTLPAANKIAALKQLPLQLVDEYYLDSYCNNELASCFNTDDNDIVISRSLIDAVMRRAAFLNAIVIGATLIKAEAGLNPDHPAVICIDGTTYYKTTWLRQHISELFDSQIRQKLQRYFVEIKVEDAPLIGTAIAGLT
ncbi:MAG: hypothetical protein FWG21_04500 [Oscillospiraceae bacterium]|nr:hypothetical protein [Oscillospiraceae bacterium]